MGLIGQLAPPPKPETPVKAKEPERKFDYSLDDPNEAIEAIMALKKQVNDLKDYNTDLSEEINKKVDLVSK